MRMRLRARLCGIVTFGVLAGLLSVGGLVSVRAGLAASHMPCQKSSEGDRLVYTSKHHPRVFSKVGLDEEDAESLFKSSDRNTLDANIRSCVQDHAPHVSPPTAFVPGVRPAHFFVISYGGSGSKTFTKFLSKYGKAYHIHDPHPPRDLRMPQPTHTDMALSVSRRTVPKEDLHLFRVIIQVRDPCEAVCSHLHLGLNPNHCRNLLHPASYCSRGPKSFEEYVRNGKDHLGFLDFYQAWLDADEAAKRNYNIVVLNFHKMWGHKEEVINALGLPKSAISAFPKASEAGAEERARVKQGCPYDGLYNIYKDVTDDIYFRLPAVSFLGPGPFP